MQNYAMLFHVMAPEELSFPFRKQTRFECLEVEQTWTDLDPASVRKGYLCLESEGSEIHFRNIRILELPPGITRPEQTAQVVD